MSSLFVGKTGIRSRYKDLAFGDLALSTDAATAKLLINFTHAGRLVFIDNATDQDLVLSLCHPDSDGSDPVNRMFWLEIPASRVLNFSTVASTNLEFDPGTQIYVHRVAAAPTTGKIRIFSW